MDVLIRHINFSKIISDLQIRKQILVPDLYVLTVELVAYKKKTKT